MSRQGGGAPKQSASRCPQQQGSGAGRLLRAVNADILHFLFATSGLGVEIGRTTVANILAEAGMEPAPERKKKRTWKQFMKAHWDSLCGCDFFAVEALGLTGTVRYMVFFVIVVKTRAVEIAGMRVDPDGEWMKQMARNLTDVVDGFLRKPTYLIHDRDPMFTEAFEAILGSAE